MNPEVQKRLIRLRREASDLTTQVEVAFSPFDSGYRESLNAGARRAAEVAISNLVGRMEIARRVLAAAEAAAKVDPYTNSIAYWELTCPGCRRWRLFISRRSFTKLCAHCGRS